MIATFFWLFILAVVAIFYVEGRDAIEKLRNDSGEPDEPEEDTVQIEG